MRNRKYKRDLRLLHIYEMRLNDAFCKFCCPCARTRGSGDAFPARLPQLRYQCYVSKSRLPVFWCLFGRWIRDRVSDVGVTLARALTLDQSQCRRNFNHNAKVILQSYSASSSYNEDHQLSYTTPAVCGRPFTAYGQGIACHAERCYGTFQKAA